MQFLVTYIQFAFYTIAEAHSTQSQPNKGLAFAGISILFMPTFFISILMLIGELVGINVISWLNDTVNYAVDVKRGFLTFHMLLVFALSILITYFLCIKNVVFEEIPQKYEQYNFFLEHKFIKAFVFLASGPLLYLCVLRWT